MHPMGVCAYEIRMRYKCISLPMAGRWKRIRLQRNRDLSMRDRRVDYYNNPGPQSCWIPMIPSWCHRRTKISSLPKGCAKIMIARTRNAGLNASKEVCALKCKSYSRTVRASLGYVFTHPLSIESCTT